MHQTPPSFEGNADLYDDAGLYNRIRTALGSDLDELAFYTGLAQRLPWFEAFPKWLELGCGSGRLTLQLAGLGHDMTGIDCSASMLSLAREQQAAQDVYRVQWHLQDLRQFKLERSFNFVLLPSNNLGHLHTLADLQHIF